MGKIKSAYILPHPPIIVPGVGNGRERDAIRTIDAVKKVAKDIAADKPTTIILSSPHSPCFRDYVYLTDVKTLWGNFTGFGCPEIRLSFENNLELLSSLVEKAKKAGISAGSLSEEGKRNYRITDQLDHGAFVPLYFIEQEWKYFQLVLISTPFFPLKEIYAFGNCIRDAVCESDENVVYIASGDLSHRLTQDAPAGYHPKGREYDEYLVERLRTGDTEGLLQTGEDFIEQAGECGTRSFVMMLGALAGDNPKADVYSYEGPYGVGYLVAKAIF